MLTKEWHNTENKVSLTISYDPVHDMSVTPDGICYKLKPWNLKHIGLYGAGFIDDNNTQITCMRGDDPYNPVILLYEKPALSNL